MNVESVSAPT